jgi:tetratricopeptide (TPR) repeat protein
LSGRFGKAIEHYDATLASGEEQGQAPSIANRGGNPDVTGVDPNIISYSIKAWSHWFVGQIDKADEASSKALEAAERSGHPFSICYALCLASSLAQCRGYTNVAQTHAEAALSLSQEYDFPYWYAWATIIRGWATAFEDRPNDGTELLIKGMARYESTNAAQMRGHHLCLLAEVYQRAGRPQEAVDTANAAILEMERTGIVFYQAEAYRLLGEGLSRLDKAKTLPLRRTTQALRIAENQRSFPLTLRAYCSLLRLAQRQRLRDTIITRSEDLLTSAEAFCPKSELAAARQLLIEAKTSGH